MTRPEGATLYLGQTHADTARRDDDANLWLQILDNFQLRFHVTSWSCYKWKMEIVWSIKLLYGLPIKSSRKFYLLFTIDFPNLSLFFIYIFINRLTVVVKFSFCMKRILIYQIVFRATLLFGNEDFLLISSIVKLIHVWIFTFTSFKLI